MVQPQALSALHLQLVVTKLGIHGLVGLLMHVLLHELQPKVLQLST